MGRQHNVYAKSLSCLRFSSPRLNSLYHHKPELNSGIKNKTTKNTQNDSHSKSYVLLPPKYQDISAITMQTGPLQKVHHHHHLPTTMKDKRLCQLCSLHTRSATPVLKWTAKFKPQCDGTERKGVREITSSRQKPSELHPNSSPNL